MSLLLHALKLGLWPIGAHLSSTQLYRLQGAVNSLRLGRWMRDHGFRFDPLVRDRWAVFDVVASEVCWKSAQLSGGDHRRSKLPSACGNK